MEKMVTSVYNLLKHNLVMRVGTVVVSPTLLESLVVTANLTYIVSVSDLGLSLGILLFFYAKIDEKNPSTNSF